MAKRIKKITWMSLFVIGFCLVAPVSLAQAEERSVLPTGWWGKYYEYQFESPPWGNSVWSCDGELPPGLELDDNTGRLFGVLHNTQWIKQEELRCEKKEYYFSIKVEKRCDKSLAQVYHVKLEVSRIPYWSAGEKFRIIFGAQQSAASSAENTKRLFLDLNFYKDFPIWFNSPRNRYIGRPLKMWGNIRFTSVPQQIGTVYGEVIEGFSNVIESLKLNEVTEAAEFLVGLDYCIVDFCGGNMMRHSLSLIAGYGAITPINPKEAVQIFKASQEVKNYVLGDQFDGEKPDEGDFVGKEYVAFLTSARDCFYRQFYAGFRFKTYFAPKIKVGKDIRGNVVSKVKVYLPATLDVSCGFNESISDNPKRPIIRVEGFFPFKVTDKWTVYLFGAVLLKTGRAKKIVPHIFEPAPADVTYPNPLVLLIPTGEGEIRRDYYRIGIGVDLRGFFR